MWNLRPADDKDLAGIISWISNANDCKFWAGPGVSFPISLDALKAEITHTPENSFCYEQRGEPVAFGQLIEKGQHHLHFARIIVDPAKRGSGYGLSLCRELIELAIDRCCHRITLNVYKNNAAALNLYQRLGFVEMQLSGEHKLSDDICFMEFQLKP